METKDILATLKGIANTPAKMLTAEDKAFVAGLATEHGVKIARKSCNSCIIDAAVQLYGILQENYKSEPTEEDGRKYILRQNVSVRYNGISVNAATMTDEKAEALIKAGLPKYLFSKLPANEN